MKLQSGSSQGAVEPNANGVRPRPARPGDAAPAADLIYLPMGKMADYLFGSDDPVRAKEVLASLFAQPKNRFSYEFCDVLDVEHRIAALLLGYPADRLKGLELPMANELRHIFSAREMFRMLRRSISLRNVSEAQAGEFYVLTISVAPEFQRHGIGRLMMNHAEKKARSLGLTKCSLGVTVDNERAIGFYEHLGYHAVEFIPIPKLEKAIGFPGSRRMVKTLSDEK